MKRLILIAALLLTAAAAPAQDWKEALKRAATTAADKASGGKLTELALVGTWNYTGPGVKFEGEDWASELGGAALEGSVTKQLEKAYLRAGIKPGACAFAFTSEKSFSATLGTHDLSGTYEYDPATHVLTLHFAKGRLNLGSVPGHAYISGSQLSLVFPVTKLVGLVEGLGRKIPALGSVSKLLERYKNVYIGFALEK